ncbi:MAG TPA: spore coat protein [Ruminococcaceae bacterium]|jgi:spore coat protein CotF|nr:spore coat protein [Oscillospiraceae bacterium]
MQEKAMVNDALSAAKSELTFYANTISECSNTSLRSTLQQIRNKCETSQYELYKLAETNGFYKPAQMAQESEIQQVKSQLQQG